jgi:hypothetical protein
MLVLGWEFVKRYDSTVAICDYLCVKTVLGRSAAIFCKVASTTKVGRANPKTENYFSTIPWLE